MRPEACSEWGSAVALCATEKENKGLQVAHRLSRSELRCAQTAADMKRDRLFFPIRREGGKERKKGKESRLLRPIKVRSHIQRKPDFRREMEVVGGDGGTGIDISLRSPPRRPSFADRTELCGDHFQPRRAIPAQRASYVRARRVGGEIVPVIREPLRNGPSR